jgi:hypothetical protein
VCPSVSSMSDDLLMTICCLFSLEGDDVQGCLRLKFCKQLTLTVPFLTEYGVGGGTEDTGRRPAHTPQQVSSGMMAGGRKRAAVALGRRGPRRLPGTEWDN